MAINETKNRQAMLAYLADTATANCEADVDAFLQVFTPADTRNEMSQIFQDNLGYDPISLYDMKDIITIVEKALDKVSEKTAQKVEKQMDQLVQEAYAAFDDARTSNLKAAISSVIDHYVNNEEDLYQIHQYLDGDEVKKPVAIDDEPDELVITDLEEDEDDEATLEVDEDDNNPLDALDGPAIPTLDIDADEELDTLVVGEDDSEDDDIYD